MTDLAVALALVLVIEGMLWAGFPEYMKRLAAQAAAVPTSLIRRGALFLMAMGVLVVWIVRG